jgi:hypothetical protein
MSPLVVAKVPDGDEFGAVFREKGLLIGQGVAAAAGAG